MPVRTYVFAIENNHRDGVPLTGDRLILKEMPILSWTGVTKAQDSAAASTIPSRNTS